MLLCFFFSALVGFTLIYGIIRYLESKNQQLKELILSDPVESYGYVVGFTSYKGKGATIEYFANGKRFEIKPSVSNEFYDNTSYGDSVAILYFKPKPENAVLKYQLALRKH